MRRRPSTAYIATPLATPTKQPPTQAPGPRDNITLRDGDVACSRFASGDIHALRRVSASHQPQSIPEISESYLRSLLAVDTLRYLVSSPQTTAQTTLRQ